MGVPYTSGINQFCCGSEGGSNPNADPQIEANGLQVVCDANDPTIKFFVNSVYDEVAATWTYTRPDTGATVVPNIDFVVCPDAPESSFLLSC